MSEVQHLELASIVITSIHALAKFRFQSIVLLQTHVLLR